MYQSIIFQGNEYNVWESTHYLFGEERRQFVHLFGEMDLPLEATYEEAWNVANNAAECCGYLAQRRQPNQLVCYGHDMSFVVTYAENKLVAIENTTVQTRIDDLHAWNNTWLDRIRQIESLEAVPYLVNLPPNKKGFYERAIAENNAKIAILEAKLKSPG